MSSKMTNEDNLKKWALVFEEDEFDDMSQNANAQGGAYKVSGKAMLDDLRGWGDLHQPSVNIGCGCGCKGVDDPTFTIEVDPSESRSGANTLQGWVENLPLSINEYRWVEVWGTLTFARSLPEAFMELNRVMVKGGTLIFDMVTDTTIPLCQTVHPGSFMNWFRLFGFGVNAMRMFGPKYHRRLGVRATKIENFNPARLRLPQSAGEIRNFLEERDWYMR